MSSSAASRCHVSRLSAQPGRALSESWFHPYVVWLDLASRSAAALYTRDRSMTLQRDSGLRRACYGQNSRLPVLPKSSHSSDNLLKLQLRPSLQSNALQQEPFNGNGRFGANRQLSLGAFAVVGNHVTQGRQPAPSSIWIAGAAKEGLVCVAAHLLPPAGLPPL